MQEAGANKILVVEDDPTVRGYLVTVLTDDGYGVTTRSSAKAAKALLKKDSFDLVISDLIMPEVSGLDLLKFIRKNKINSEVIILTAFGDMDSVLEALRAGADDFLLKPCDRLVLHKAITRAFKKINLEREKKKSDERYYTLFESTTDMVFMLDAKGIVTEMNSRGLEIFGRTRGQIIGKPYKRLIHKEDYMSAVKAFEETVSGEIKQFVARIRPKDDSLWYFEFNYSPLFSDGKVQGAYCIAHDITQLKQLQNQLEEYSHNLEQVVEERTRELKASEERFRRLTATAKDAVITVNSEGRITFANSAAGRILSCDPDALIDWPIEEIIPSQGHDSSENPVGPYLKKAKGSDEGVTVEVSAKRKSGDEFPAEVSISSFEIQDEIYATVLLRDITSRAELATRIRQRQKMESIGRLAGGIAHNLNNILCGLLGYASFLKSTADRDSEHYRYLETMEVSCVKASDLVRQILEYAEGGKYHVEVCDPNKLVSETVEFLKRSIPRNIAIESRTAPSTRCIECDPSQVRQVLLNLSINAREAMPEGGTLSFNVANAKVDAKLNTKHPDLEPGEYVAISVKDTGAGINDKEMDQIFEPFYSTKSFGYGMGLSSSLGIIQKHKGVIEVESGPQGGTAFTIYLPSTDKTPAKRPVQDPGEFRHGTETVLVVDDEQVFCELVRDVLERAGYSVIVAETGNQGIKTFDKHKKKIDLVLIDIILPDMSGEDLLKTIHKSSPNTKLAITSGCSLQEVPDELKAYVDGAFLQKPCTAEKMTEVVRRALDRKS